MLLPRAHASVLSALLLLALLLGVTAPVSAEDTTQDEERSATVVLPDIKGINPTIDEYVVEVADTSYDTLRASWKGHRTTLAADGPTTVALPVDGAGRVTVEGCVKRSCTQVERSERLVVLRALQVSWGGTVRVNEGEAFVDGVADQELPGRYGHVAWELRDADPAGPPVASGESSWSSRSRLTGTRVRFAVQVPAGLDETEHELRAELSSSTPVFGDLADDLTGTVVVDRTVPVIGSLTLSRDTIYPPRDKYLDATVIKAAVPADTVGGSYVVEAVDGEVVASGDLEKRRGTDLRVATWRGTRRDGTSLPTGEYVVRAEVEDEAGNRSAPVETTVAVVAQRLRQHKFDLRMRPADAEIHRNVGRCSRLKSPSSRRLPGSVGYFSELRCSRSAEAHVVTSNGVYLPPTADGHYKKLQLRVTGGRSQRHRNGALPYLVVHFENRKGRLVERTQLGRRYREWRLDKVGDEVVHDRKAERPYVIWVVGLSEGSRYDVDEYRLRGFRSVLKDVPTD
ncbi:hypothetical protein BKA08_000476 [Nocardioides marinisabuli]|uniref:Ig-like domain (Group 3) n=1 Tax=Nocardioides marinisabuli TaxID=419476 RepID=A0A7Y9EYG5_9ACTN|nr:hypothetical protein [Nocardioides marinisabuli]NYD56238.1 hypothetical protein [Nocardioides marinisabuli]